MAPRSAAAPYLVQRFGSRLNANRHVHVLIPGGVWVPAPDGAPTFVPADTPSDEDIQQLVVHTALRVVRLRQRRALLDDDRNDPLAQDQPLLAALTAASVQGRAATGPPGGERLRRHLADPADGRRTAPLCWAACGFSLHSATRVEADDRTRLERLCHDVLRPPLPAPRLRFLGLDSRSTHLDGVGPDSRPPPIAPVRLDPQPALDCAG